MKWILQVVCLYLPMGNIIFTSRFPDYLYHPFSFIFAILYLSVQWDNNTLELCHAHKTIYLMLIFKLLAYSIKYAFDCLNFVNSVCVLLYFSIYSEKLLLNLHFLDKTWYFYIFSDKIIYTRSVPDTRDRRCQVHSEYLFHVRCTVVKYMKNKSFKYSCCTLYRFAFKEYDLNDKVDFGDDT